MTTIRLDISIWLLLIFFTIASIFIGTDNFILTDKLSTIFIIIISISKVSLVIWYFMEVKRAEIWLKLLMAAWCLIVACGLIAIELLG